MKKIIYAAGKRGGKTGWIIENIEAEYNAGKECFYMGGRKTFEDITKRIPSLNNPAEMIVNRVKQELDTTTAKKGKKKYYLFTPIPKAQKKHRNPRNSRNQRK